jgi:DNA-directed RNA polymerase subunit RPC12/RpoP
MADWNCITCSAELKHSSKFREQEWRLERQEDGRSRCRNCLRLSQHPGAVTVFGFGQEADDGAIGGRVHGFITQATENPDQTLDRPIKCTADVPRTAGHQHGGDDCERV